MSTNFDRVEFFHSSDYADYKDDEGNSLENGFYYWYCFPGCLPDSQPIGPFETIKEAQDDYSENEDEQDSLYDDDSDNE